MAVASKDEAHAERRYLALPSYLALKRACGVYLAKPALDVIQRAYLVAARAHEGTLRHSGEPYIEHPLAVALWLAERRVTVECVAAALLHDVVEDTPMSLQGLRHRFGAVIAELVDGVTKFDAVEDPDDADDVARVRERKRRVQAETFRKLLLAMAEDPRVALIKLADRLHNIRTLGAMRPDRQIAKARETLDIYVPLAQRLGMAAVKYELEDLALSYLEPAYYAWLRRRIAEEIAARAEHTATMTRALRHLMTQHHLDAEVHAREKHLYSVYRRVKPSGLDVREVQDLITFDVLVPTRPECYAALQAIHGQWQQIDARLRDYIGSSQKLNGYQALHTTVFCFDGLFDIHIRTHEMQRLADDGPILLAATQPNVRGSRGQSLAWIEQVRAWQRELPQLSAAEFVETIQNDLFRDQIFVVTPKGAVKDLPGDATVLDFAYRVHTDLGEHCAGAKITGADNVVRHEGPEYALQSGEIVNVQTNSQIRPNAGWLRIARTRHARDAILHYLRLNNLPTEEPIPAATPEVPLELLARARLAFCCEPGPDDELIGIVAGRSLSVHCAACHHVAGEPIAERYQDGAARQFLRLQWGLLHPDGYRVTLDIMGRDRSGLIRDIADVLYEAGINVARVGAHSIGSRFKATMFVTVEVRDPAQLERVEQRLLGVDGVVSVERRQRITPDDDHRHTTAMRPSL